MPLSWKSMPLPLFQGGEDTATAPLVSQDAMRLENALLTGIGVVAQIPDWRVAATCTNGAVTPLETVAVCAIFPFAERGTATGESAGVAFSFDPVNNKILLHQIGEDDTILRTVDAITGYTEALPPQITGFEMFAKFYFCADGREEAANRTGLHVFDPETGVCTQITADVGGGVAPLRFKGIAKHRGATILGWGYYDNAEPDRPEVVRYCKYGYPDVWVPDTDPTTASWFQLGTRGLPVTAAAASGQYTILGKPTEIFALDGDYSEQFYAQPIGQAHGPLSVTGMVSTGPLAVWMSEQGPVLSSNGARPELIGTNRLTRRMATYYSLTYACAVHDSPRTRVGWLLRRATDLDGVGLDGAWGDQILWWDYQRDAFTVQGTPTTCFAIGTTEGAQLNLVGPVGVPIPTNNVPTGTTCALSWIHAGGDERASIYLEYRPTSASVWTVVGPMPPGTTATTITGLSVHTKYTWRLRYYRNGQYGAYVVGNDFTTLAVADAQQPSSFVVTNNSREVLKGVAYGFLTLRWVNVEQSTGTVTEVWEGTTSDFAAATQVATLPLPTNSWSNSRVSSGTFYWYWVRARNGSGYLSPETALAENPINYGLA